MTDKIKTGIKGEIMAADFLMNKGYEIIARNYRFKRSEIDLIAQYKDILVFVEVKTRKSTLYGEPETFVSAAKALKIFQGAEEYIVANNWQGNIRFDIVSIKTGRDAEIVHFEDAFH